MVGVAAAEEVDDGVSGGRSVVDTRLDGLAGEV